MTHYMNLNPSPFSKIASGSKTIELRLLDEKRQMISIGDTLVFTNTEDAVTTITCEVIRLHVFSDFEELYKSLPLDKCGYASDEISSASPSDMELYYSKEKQRCYGVVGIEIEVKKNT